MMGLSALMRGHTRELLSLLCPMRTREDSHLQPGRELPPGVPLAHIMMVDFPLPNL